MNKELLKDWFHYHLSARRGIWILCLLLLFSVACKIFLPRWIHPKYEPLSAKTIEIKEILSLKVSDSDSSHIFYSEPREENMTELFPFDPNSLDDVGWKNLGLSEGQVKSIRKYLNSGGKFKIKTDLSKMYVVSKEMYTNWEPFILLPSELTPNKIDYSSSNKSESKKEFHVLNLNRADSAELLNLPGIGPYYAGAIVKYRNRLGGFLRIEQLLDVWKMKPETVDLIRDKVHLDPNDVSYIQINTVNADQLSLHPYFNPSKAKALISYREKHGPFQQTQDILKCLVIDELTFQKILPYIKF
jgi:competence protein ComEA